MRGALIFTAILLAVPVAFAQDEPTVNDSDYDTDPPADDQTYLDDAEVESSTMSDSEFDTAVPTADESYLDEAETETDAGTGSSASGGDNTPGIALAVMLAALGVAALARRKA